MPEEMISRILSQFYFHLVGLSSPIWVRCLGSSLSPVISSPLMSLLQTAFLSLADNAWFWKIRWGFFFPSLAFTFLPSVVPLCWPVISSSPESTSVLSFLSLFLSLLLLLSTVPFVSYLSENVHSHFSSPALQPAFIQHFTPLLFVPH